MTVTAIAATGYEFKQWIGTGAVSLSDLEAASTTATYYEEDFKLTAVFKKKSDIKALEERESQGHVSFYK